MCEAVATRDDLFGYKLFADRVPAIVAQGWDPDACHNKLRCLAIGNQHCDTYDGPLDPLDLQGAGIARNGAKDTIHQVLSQP